MVQRWHLSSILSSVSVVKEENDRLSVTAGILSITTTPKILSTSPSTSSSVVINERAPIDDSDVIGASPLTSSSIFPLTAFFISSGIVGSVMILTLPFIVMPFIRGQTLPYMATPKRKIRDALKFIQQQQQRHRRIRSQQHENGDNGLIVTSQTTRQFLDLGSGDGETVYQAVQLFNSTSSSNDNVNHITEDNKSSSSSHYYYTKCIGIELNTTLYLWSNWRRMMFWSRPEQWRSQFICRNLFLLQPPSHPTTVQGVHPIPPPPPYRYSNHHLIRQSDTIMIFGIPSLMVPLSQLLVEHKCQSGTYILSYRFPLPTTVDSCSQDNLDNDNNVGDDHSLLCAKLIYDQEEMRIYECTGTNHTL